MKEIFGALKLDGEIETVGIGRLPSRYAVTDLAANSIGAVGLAIASLMRALGAPEESLNIVVDRRLASHWFAWSIHPIDWQMPPVWDAIAGDYKTQDGWIKLHTNLPHHRRAACQALGVDAERAAVEAAVATWNGDDLETAIVAAGGVSAVMRSRAEWISHPQGAKVASEPLVAWLNARPALPKTWRPSANRPLAGVRVLDLTRVLAGPVATRTLAGFGADVLRIDPPEWQEPNVVPDITLGKCCARLDLKEAEARRVFEQLLVGADVLVHGYRPGALDGLGFGEAWRKSTAPHLIDVSLDAYGWTGPWAMRRGFDSLVQMSSGIASAGMGWAQSDKPTPLPVQALDHATGYLMAAAAISSLTSALEGRKVHDAKLSLARTAALLIAHEQKDEGDAIGDVQPSDFTDDIEVTPWGAAHRLKSPLRIGDVSMSWKTPASELGAAAPRWA